MSYELIILLPYCIANMKKTPVCVIFLFVFSFSKRLVFLANISNTALSYRHQVFVLEKKHLGPESCLVTNELIEGFYYFVYIPSTFVWKYPLINEIKFCSQKSFCFLLV